MNDQGVGGLSVRACRPQDVEGALDLWRQAEATPGVTDTAEDLRRAVAGGPAVVLVAEVGGRVIDSGGSESWS
jgi:hypothetical protein